MGAEVTQRDAEPHTVRLFLSLSLSKSVNERTHDHVSEARYAHIQPA